MILVSLDKIVTIMKDLGKGRTSIFSIRYKKLEETLKNESIIEVKYPYGKRNQRTKQLMNLGFKLKETIWYNTDAPYSEVREIWERI
ncbi:hypothetical protein HUN92_13440 [Bacillus firmus]|uniref:hypothetical protein n=1 Tax=Cytobacillus firmus TaxID=1399 RepID=UPI001580A705|nr:hypothetical protein [Cytobacillus firmus]NUH84723.1 hypothetical protein [Cytobacillus firmus]